MSHNIKFWSESDLGRENSATYYRQDKKGSCFLLFSLWSRLGHLLRPGFVLWLVKNLTGGFMRKIYAASGNLFTYSWSWQSFVSSSCFVLNCLFPLVLQNDIQLRSRFSCIYEFHGWFVYWVFGWEMRRLSKWSEIRFHMVSFSFFALLDR